MKRILVFSHAMELGGAEKALLGLLEVFDPSEYAVDLFLMRHTGELMKYIPKKIRLLPEEPRYACLAVPIADVLRRGQFTVALGRLIGKRKAQKRVRALGLGGDNIVALEYSHKYTSFAMPEIGEGTYDLAVSFLTPHYFVAQKVRAKKKIAWIHTDYANIGLDRESELKMWNRYDRIAAISPAVENTFVQVFPMLKEKVVQIENIMPAQYMCAQADAFSALEEMPEDGSIRILSVGRFSHAKNFDSVPYLCRKIREAGVNIHWYLIGYGGEEALIRSRIAQERMEGHVTVLGKKENPYPYFKACDVYAQPSRYEGKCVSVVEAQMMHKPVVITAYATAGSNLRDGIDGLIVPQEPDECVKAMAAFLQDRAMQQRLAENTLHYDYAKANEIQKIYRLMEQ